MPEELVKLIERYASCVLEWLDLDAEEYHLHRSKLLEQFIDTINAKEQTKEQED